MKDYDSPHNLPIYAITDKKEYANRFESERNMKHFIKVVKKNLDKDEAKEFVNVHSRTRLEEMSYGMYQKVEENVYGPVKYVDILSTNAEYVEVSTMANDGLFSVIESSDFYLPYPYNYKNKYIDALEKLEMLKCWKYLEYGGMFGNSLAIRKVNGKSTDLIPDDYDDGYDYPDVVIDELAVFISLYGDQFNPAFFEEDKDIKESKE
jgi:hypothetical protein